MDFAPEQTEMPPDEEQMPPEMMAMPEAPPAPVCFDPEANLGELDTHIAEDYQPRSMDDRRQSVVMNCVETFEGFKTHPMRLQAERSWNLAYRLVMAWKETASSDEIVLQEVWREVETMLPQMKGLGKDFKYEARQSGAEDIATAATAIVQDQWQRFGSNVDDRDFKKNLVMYGNAYKVPTWTRFKRMARKIKSMHAAEAPTVWDRRTNEVIEEGPVLRHVQMWNVFTHPKVAKAENSPAVFIVEGMSADALKTMVREGYLEVDATEECVKAMMTRYQEADGRRDGRMMDEGILDRELHTYMTCWINGWEYIVADDHFLLRAVKLQDGKIPIVSERLYPMAEEHYSEGLPIKLASLQRVVNQTATYRMGQLGFAAQPVLKVVKGSSAETEWANGRKIRPGSVLRLDKLTDAEYLQYPMGTMQLLAEDIGFWQEKQKSQTGITDRLSGQGDNTGTATLGVRLQAAATERIAYLVDGMVPGYTQQYQWMYNLNAWHLQTPYSARINRDGKKFKEQYTPVVFEPDIDVEVKIGTAVGPEQVNMWINIAKSFTGISGAEMLPLFDEALLAAGKTRDEIEARFHSVGPNAQGDALKDIQQWKLTGFMPEVKPNDDHMVHVQIKSMYMQGPEFQQLAMALPQWAANFTANVGTHQAYVQQMMQMQAQQQEMMQQGGGQGVGGGETPVNKEANNRANASFDMAASGGMGRGAA